MEILFLTQIVPYPPDAGPKVKTWHVLRYLAGRGHNVTLATFVRPEEEKYLQDLRQVCTSIHTVPIRRSRLADVGYWLKSNLSGDPFLIERDNLEDMRTLVAMLVKTHPFQVIHTDQLTMTQFALPYARMGDGGEIGNGQPQPVLVFDAHNAVWTIVERMRETAPAVLRPVAALEAGRIKRYEGKITRCFDHTLAVTEPDRQALLQAVAATGVRDGAKKTPSITVVPIAVDVEQIQPVKRPEGSLNIVTLGTLHYPPNADGIRWFMNEVFPLIRRENPAVTLTVIGKNPPADFLQAAHQHPGRIQVTGYVPDLTPYMEKAALMVVAVRAGGGMRVRILEAFARAMPVITTTIGLEGIDARPGEDVLVADTAESFAQATISLLEDKVLQAKLAGNGRRLAETRYDWQVVLGKMDEIYGPGLREMIERKSVHV
jgi:polysaccharide biosynthesis protein PslH